jgi:hypothetical protein
LEDGRIEGVSVDVAAEGGPKEEIWTAQLMTSEVEPKQYSVIATLGALDGAKAIKSMHYGFTYMEPSDQTFKYGPGIKTLLE